MKTQKLKSPFPWFGGKSRVAPIIWEYFKEDIPHYIEPFAGSLAVLLNRPSLKSNNLETINDIDGYIINFWRAVKYDPEGVAYYANDIPNEIDLTARHIWLVNEGKERIERLFGDPEYYDSKVAGWWLYGISLWIGAGWCSGKGKWTSYNGKLISIDDLKKLEEDGITEQKTQSDDKVDKAVNKQKPYMKGGSGVHRINLRARYGGVYKKKLSMKGGKGIDRLTLRAGYSCVTKQKPNMNSGKGVNRLNLRARYGCVNKQKPYMNSGMGINRLTLRTKYEGVKKKKPYMRGGMGINRLTLRTKYEGVSKKRIQLFKPGMGVNRNSLKAEYSGVRFGELEIYEYMKALSERLRYVRIVNGDWERVVTTGVLSTNSRIGIFLDPPYSKELRDDSLYNTDIDKDDNVNARVYKWCLENQDNPKYWIALCGYDGEYHLPGWYVYSWSANASYQNSRTDGKNKENRHKERIWFNKPFHLAKEEV